MRTTVTLDDDVAERLKADARERSVSFKQAINDAVREALSKPRPASKPYRAETFEMKARPGINLTKALQLAGELEDQELIRKMRLGK